MKLFGSLLTTGLIIGVVWGIALLQVPSAEANTDSAQSTSEDIAQKTKQNISAKVEATSSQVNEQSKSSYTTALYNLAITGVSERISLSNIDLLWQTFEDKTILHARLVKQPSKVYVYYRNFSKNYQSADVSIGYLTEIVKPATKATAQLRGTYQQLLKKAVYTSAELATAWQKIDYRKQVHSVVEVHYLDKNSQPTSTQVLVKYL